MDGSWQDKRERLLNLVRETYINLFYFGHDDTAYLNTAVENIVQAAGGSVEFAVAIIRTMSANKSNTPNLDVFITKVRELHNIFLAQESLVLEYIHDPQRNGLFGATPPHVRTYPFNITVEEIRSLMFEAGNYAQLMRCLQ